MKVTQISGAKPLQNKTGTAEKMRLCNFQAVTLLSITHLKSEEPSKHKGNITINHKYLSVEMFGCRLHYDTPIISQY